MGKKKFPPSYIRQIGLAAHRLPDNNLQKTGNFGLTCLCAMLYCGRSLIDETQGDMMNDEVAKTQGGRGISKDILFVRANDNRISQEHGAADLQSTYSLLVYCFF